MISPESQKAKLSLQKDYGDQNISLAQERADWDRFGAQLPLHPSVKSHQEEIGGVPCLVVQPEHTGSSTIIFAHGGGLTAGSILTHRAFVSVLAFETGCRIILPDYRLLPENPVAAPRDDLVKVYEACRLDDPDQAMVFGGDSTGAGLMFAAMIHLRDRSERLPDASFSLSGAFDATLSGATHASKDDVDPVLSNAALRHWQTNFPVGFAFDDPIISPLFADVSGLPPTLLLVGDDEVWLDDTRRMAEKLKQAGVKSEKVEFGGMWHVFPMMTELPEAKSAMRQISQFLNATSDVGR